MIALIGAPISGFSSLPGHVNLTSENGFDSVPEGQVMKLYGSEEVSMVGQSQGGHLQFSCPPHHRFELIGSVEEAKVTVKMEVNEIAHACLFFTKSLPLNRAGWFGTDVVNDAVDPSNFVDNSIGEAPQ